MTRTSDEKKREKIKSKQFKKEVKCSYCKAPETELVVVGKQQYCRNCVLKMQDVMDE